MPRISACVITYNEERSIERCLRSLKAFADEIVVVDAFSTDRTPELARGLATKVAQSKWQGFARQRNVGLDNCASEWVFFLDADEEATPSLARA
jgi:glycosyltransferase involved in cell wall biosynthesis